MAELNPHRTVARTFAFACYIVAGLVLIASIFFTLAAANMDVSELKLEGMTNQRMVAMVLGPILVVSLMIVLVGWRAQSLFGQHRRKDKLAAKSAVGCLRLGSLGCFLWAVLAAASILLTGKIITFGGSAGPAGLRELFVLWSGVILVVSLMLAVSWFISVQFAVLNPKERLRAYDAYQDAIRPYLFGLAELEARAFVQEQTIEVLEKLDTSLKSTLLEFLGRSGLLSGDTRLSLEGADFRRVNLSSINLPRADLHGINLERAILRDAVLFKTNLQKARLKYADLSRANLQEADLRQADLTGAVLEETNLGAADLTATKLTPAQRNQARQRKTILPDVH